MGPLPNEGQEKKRKQTQLIQDNVGALRVNLTYKFDLITSLHNYIIAYSKIEIVKNGGTNEEKGQISIWAGVLMPYIKGMAIGRLNDVFLDLSIQLFSLFFFRLLFSSTF